MAIVIKTYQDGTPSGTFSQINLDDGSKILISLTKTEIALLKVGFLGIPLKKIWHMNMFDYLDVVYPQGPNSVNYPRESVLRFSVNLAFDCKTLEEVVRVFNGLK